MYFVDTIAEIAGTLYGTPHYRNQGGVSYCIACGFGNKITKKNVSIIAFFETCAKKFQDKKLICLLLLLPCASLNNCKHCRW